MKRKIVAVLLIITTIVSFSACSMGKNESRYQAQHLDLFDTVTTIIGYAEVEEAFTEYAQLIYDNLKEYHELYDIYNDYEGINNIKTINDNAGIVSIKVDQRIIDLLLFSKEMYQLTDGKINVAYGAVLEVWHDYRIEGIENPDLAKLPPMELLKEKAEHTDINQVIINEEEATVYLEDSKMRLDVGAIAKGYAARKVVQLMIEEGYTDGLLSVGGNVCAIGSRGEQDNAWNVGIQNPDLESDDSYLLITQLKDFSLVSSGDYERYYTVNGVRYHHIIDPETLMPADYFTAVSIISKDSGMADALSTAIFNMPLDEGLELIEGLEDTEALWVKKDGKLFYSSGFEQYIKK